MDNYMAIIDTFYFWRYRKVWDYVKKNGKWQNPDFTDIVESCWITNLGDFMDEIMDMSFAEYSGDPVKYLKELLDGIYCSTIQKATPEDYYKLISLKEEIDKIRSWEWNKAYSIKSIALELMDSVYSNSYKVHTKTLIPELDEIIWWWVLLEL